MVDELPVHGSRSVILSLELTPQVINLCLSRHARFRAPEVQPGPSRFRVTTLYHPSRSHRADGFIGSILKSA